MQIYNERTWTQSIQSEGDSLVKCLILLKILTFIFFLLGPQGAFVLGNMEHYWKGFVRGRENATSSWWGILWGRLFQRTMVWCRWTGRIITWWITCWLTSAHLLSWTAKWVAGKIKCCFIPYQYDYNSRFPVLRCNTYFPNNNTGTDTLFPTAHTSRKSCRLRENVRNPARICMRRWSLWTQRPQQHRSELSRQCWRPDTCSGGRHWAPLPAWVSGLKDSGWVWRRMQFLPFFYFPFYHSSRTLYVSCVEGKWRMLHKL